MGRSLGIRCEDRTRCARLRRQCWYVQRSIFSRTEFTLVLLRLTGVKIFQADIIYHLFDMFIAHRERVKKENQEKCRHLAVFPCKLKVLPQYVFNSRDPIICGVIVEDGLLKLGTPICVPSKEVGRD